MGKKNSSAPAPDKNVGLAAMESAKLGRDYFAWMKERSAVTDQWADEDRSWFNTNIRPLQDQYIEKAKNWATPERQQQAAAEARADVMSSSAAQEQQRKRSLAAMGVSPDSGMYAGVDRASALGTGLAAAGAENLAKRAIRTEGMDMLGQAVNMGAGMSVNPLSSFTAGTSAGSAGFSGAMQGVGQQANILNQQWRNRMDAWQANQAQQGSLWGGIGNLVGMGAAFLSDEDKKENKRPARDLLGAVRRMRVDNWKYKDGHGDSGEHVGTYAQDFARETGRGDGRSINVIDAIGVTMGALKELDAKVDSLSTPRRRRAPSEMKAAA